MGIKVQQGPEESPGAKLFRALCEAIGDLSVPDKMGLNRVIQQDGEFDELPEDAQEALESLAARRWL